MSPSPVKTEFQALVNEVQAQYDHLMGFKYGGAFTEELQLYDLNQQTDEQVQRDNEILWTAFAIVAGSVAEPIDWGLALAESLHRKDPTIFMSSFLPGSFGFWGVARHTDEAFEYAWRYGDDSYETVQRDINELRNLFRSTDEPNEVAQDTLQRRLDDFFNPNPDLLRDLPPELRALVVQQNQAYNLNVRGGDRHLTYDITAEYSSEQWGWISDRPLSYFEIAIIDVQGNRGRTMETVTEFGQTIFADGNAKFIRGKELTIQEDGNGLYSVGVEPNLGRTIHTHPPGVNPEPSDLDFTVLVDNELIGIENYQTVIQRGRNYVIHYWVDEESGEFMQVKEYLAFTLPK